MKIFFIIATVTLVAFSPADGAVFTHLSAEDGKVDYDFLKDQGHGWYSEPSGNYRFKLGFKQGERTSTNPVFVATVRSTETEHYQGKAALEFQITAHKENKSLKAAYKVDISSVLPTDTFAPQVQTPKDWFHGFAIKIDPSNYQLPDGPGQELIFEQWWQGSPFHPPVALAIINEIDSRNKGWPEANTNGNFALVLRDDDHNAWGSGPGQPRYYNLGPARTGQWIKWVVCVRPSPSGKEGGVTVTIDGTERLRLTDIAVGYDRTRYRVKPTPARTLAVDCCIYRANGPGTQRIYFDEIKFADSFADAVSQ